MNRTPLSLAALAVLLPLRAGWVQPPAAGSSARQESSGQENSGQEVKRQEEKPAAKQEKQDGPLRRVAPAQEGDAGRSQDHLFARDFDRADWKERLQQTDLDRRERDLEGLLKRACFDGQARVFLEDLAHDPKGGELAWTARLALRELGRPHFPMQFSLTGPRLGDQMERALNEWMSRGGMGVLIPPSNSPSARAPNALEGRSVSIEQTETGARVEITSTRDGKDEKRRFEGRSLDEILEQNPELKKELNGLSLRVRAGTPLDLSFPLDVHGNAPGATDPGTGLHLAPEGRARPLRTDKLGVLVQKITPQHAQELGLAGQGLYVEHSYPQTLAQLLGVGSGDVLLELDGVPLREIDDIEKGLKARVDGEPFTLSWIDELGQRQKKSWPSEGGR